MTRVRNIILLFLLLAWAVGAQGARSAKETKTHKRTRTTKQQQSAKDVRIHNGMGTGQDYIGIPESTRPTYVMGLVNGLFLSPLFGASRQNIVWLETCLEEKTGTQIAEILSQYIEQHPTELREQLHAASYRALLQACPSSPLHQR